MKFDDYVGAIYFVQDMIDDEAVDIHGVAPLPINALDEVKCLLKQAAVVAERAQLLQTQALAQELRRRL